jgi:hypothetical protein
MNARHAFEPLREGHGEQERKENLDSWKGSAQLVEELDELAVEPFFLVFALGHGRRLPRHPGRLSLPTAP